MKLLLVLAFVALMCMARSAPTTTTARVLIFPNYNDGEDVETIFGANDIDTDIAAAEDEDDSEETTTTTTSTRRSTYVFPTRNRNLIPSRRPVQVGRKGAGPMMDVLCSNLDSTAVIDLSNNDSSSRRRTRRSNQRLRWRLQVHSRLPQVHSKVARRYQEHRAQSHRLRDWQESPTNRPTKPRRRMNPLNTVTNGHISDVLLISSL